MKKHVLFLSVPKLLNQTDRQVANRKRYFCKDRKIPKLVWNMSYKVMLGRRLSALAFC